LPSVVVFGNQQHLRQVVYNLLDNALKFTPAGGRVTIQLFADHREETIVFAVRDSGPGIPEDELPHVFDRFFQGRRPRTSAVEKRGTGLGLSICQAIIRAHDGTIEVESKIGEGTCFTVRLPSGGQVGRIANPSLMFETDCQSADNEPAHAVEDGLVIHPTESRR
jgi:signal transduction histidine kinase